MYRILVFMALAALTQPVYADQHKTARAHRPTEWLLATGKENDCIPREWLPFSGPDDLRNSVVVASVQEPPTCKRVLRTLSRACIPSFFVNLRGFHISVRQRDRERATALIRQDALRAGYRHELWLPPPARAVNTSSATASGAMAAVTQGVIWGAVVDGLQAGIGYQSGTDRFAFRDNVDLFVYLRNTSDREIEVSCTSKSRHTLWSMRANDDHVYFPVEKVSPMLTPMPPDAQRRHMRVVRGMDVFPWLRAIALRPGESGIVSRPYFLIVRWRPMLIIGYRLMIDMFCVDPGRYTVHLPPIDFYVEQAGPGAQPVHRALSTGELPLEVVTQ